MIRDVACFRVQSTAYRCKKDTYFPFSEKLTIVWLASLCICIAIFVIAFRNVPQFPGYEAILYKLMFVPSFSTLVLLLTLAICRYIKLFIYIESSESRVIIFFLKRSCVLRTLAVGFLNYTRFNFLEKNYHNVCVYKQFVLALLSISAEALPASSLHRVMGQGTPPFIFTMHHGYSSLYNTGFEAFLVLSWPW